MALGEDYIGHGKHESGDNAHTLPEGQALARHSQTLIGIERLNRIVGLRRRGLTYAQISEVLAKGTDGGEPIGLTESGVAGLVRRYLRRIETEATESVEELRVLENERLDELIAVHAQRARDGDTKSAGVVLRAMERRAKLNGLDAAHRVEHSFSGDMLRELGADPEELARAREAFHTAGVIDGTVVEDAPDDGVAAEAPAAAVQDDRPGEAASGDESVARDGV